MFFKLDLPVNTGISFDFDVVNIFFFASGLWALYKLSRAARVRAKMTRLRGPPASNWLFGVFREAFMGESAANLYEKWADEYGPVYQIPGPLGSRRTVLTDAKAVAHFYSKEPFGYVKDSFSRQIAISVVGKGLFWAVGKDHTRQRKTLTPAFSNIAIRDLTPVFYDSAYKVKSVWDALSLSSSSGEFIVDVQKWMNCVSLDSIGIAGFSHNFGTLEGRHSDVAEMFDSFGSNPPDVISAISMLLGPVLPFLGNVPTKRQRMIAKLNSRMEEIAGTLLERSRKEKEAGLVGDTGRSIIGALLKAENSESELRLTKDEALAQMKVLILAGYETTSISLTWALIELALHPEKQNRLRAELSDFSGHDPSPGQLANGLPYLEGIMCETFRLHSPVHRTNRVAAYDDVIPLRTPVTTASGESVDCITVAGGASLVVPILAVNRSEAIWGADAKEFKPERWLDGEAGLTPKAKELQGYHHLLTFIDGPRTCLGRGFAVTEFKSVLSVLVRNYVFSMRDGPGTKVEMITAVLPRPKVVGENGYAVPMRVRRAE
ncbi:hypothetical protein M0805_009525 [Coniferiporia weirii]|nr:hypothetical protein M0805_009525 [Coniferiporia weirii]